MCPTPPEGFDSWHALHREALERLDAMEQALAREAWGELDLGARWIYQVLRPHNEAEETDLFPRLDALGAQDLRHQLHLGHREMWDLNLRLLACIDEGQVLEAERTGDLARTLLALIRRHIGIEETRLLPLLEAQASGL